MERIVNLSNTLTRCNRREGKLKWKIFIKTINLWILLEIKYYW